MKPVSPVIPNKEYPELKIAEHQDEYETLPAINCGEGCLLTRWEFTEEEKKAIQEKGYFYLYIYNFGNPVQPLYLTSEEPLVRS